MMILCLTGTNPYSFLRLVSYVDKVLGVKHKVIIQLGNTRFDAKNSICFDFCERKKIFKYCIQLVLTKLLKNFQ